jgi:hypothetical protein
MRDMFFLFPHLDMHVGGNSAQQRFAAICAGFRTVRIVTYLERVAGVAYLDDVLRDDPAGAIYVVHWGPHLDWLIGRLAGRDVIYFAHSTGWGVCPPPSVPIVAVSRHSLAYWGRHAPNSPIDYVPNVIGPEFKADNCRQIRDIDILVQRRKSSRYLLHQLVPRLQGSCNVVVQEDWVDDLSKLLQRTKVYLYDSLEHWIAIGATEGFGLPPLEALACGCVVFSSLNDALADYLTPGVNCHKIRIHSTAYDVSRILRAVNNYDSSTINAALLKQYRRPEIEVRLRRVIEELDTFFAISRHNDPDLPDIAVRPAPRSVGHRVKAYMRHRLPLTFPMRA